MSYVRFWKRNAQDDSTAKAMQQAVEAVAAEEEAKEADAEYTAKPDQE